MKSIFVLLCFCLIFVPILNVHGNNDELSETKEEEEAEEEEEEEVDFGELRDRLNVNGANINGALQISPGNYLGEGGYGLVYRGIRMNDSRPVAVKFIDSLDAESAEREYTIYSYLHAIDNATVERYGIPCVYFYSKWERFIIMAITLCEGSLNKRRDDFSAFPLNALIVFQQFVSQSKYLHSHGVRHDDIKPDNILLRKYQTFLIDYNLGSEMNKDTQLCTYKYKPRRSHHTDQNRKAIDDWESFFYAMCKLVGVPLKWFSGEEYMNLNEEDQEQKYGEAKKDVKDIINKIKAIDSTPMKNVFMAFAREIFSKNAKDFPNYDWMDQFIAIQIKRVLKRNQPILFTWIPKKDNTKTFKHIRMNPIPNIRTDITDPSQFNFVYPNVNVDYFNGTTTAVSSGLHQIK